MLNRVVERARQLFLAPRTELARALLDPGDTRSLLQPYVLVLAALGPAARWLSAGLIGIYVPPTRIFGTTVAGGYHRAPGYALGESAMGYALGLGVWWLFAQVLARLAPRFGGRLDLDGGRRLAAAALTPSWVAAALTLLHSVPHLGGLASLAMLAGIGHTVLLGLWGAPLHLGIPPAKAPGHVLASAAVTAVAAVLVGSLLGPLLY